MSVKTEVAKKRNGKQESQIKQDIQGKDELQDREEPDSEVEYDGIKVIQEFMLTAEIGESPININLSKTIPISLPLLQWHHHDLPPKKMKCTNTGHTLILSAKWHQERPHLSGGPLFSNYVFSQMHFHWGKNDMEGSEHKVDGAQQPLEMHVVLFKSCYLTQEAALKKKDGIVVLVYFFKLQAGRNAAMEILTDAIPYIQMPHSSARLDNLPLSFLTVPFEKDYFMYWGTVTTSECVHVLLWLISREPLGISAEQLDCFRSLLNVEEQPLQGNFRPIQDSPNVSRTIFHANPSYSLYSTLLPIRKPPELHLKKLENEVKVEKNYEMEGAEIYKLEAKQDNPFKSEKNKYTISTSIKVHPELLQKLRQSGNNQSSIVKNSKAVRSRSNSTEKVGTPKSASDDSKNKSYKGCLFENVSAMSNVTDKPVSQTRTRIPEPVQRLGLVKSRNDENRPSQIPKAVKK